MQGYVNQTEHTSASKKILSHNQKRIMRYGAAGLCFLSELIHLWLLPEQYETFMGYGLIFLLIAIAQGIVSVNLLFAPRRRTFTFGIRVNIVTIFLYIFTHTIGVLAGLSFLPLPIDALGISATLAELGIVVIFYSLRRDFPRIKKVKVKKEKSIRSNKKRS